MGTSEENGSCILPHQCDSYVSMLSRDQGSAIALRGAGGGPPGAIVCVARSHHI